MESSLHKITKHLDGIEVREASTENTYKRSECLSEARTCYHWKNNEFTFIRVVAEVTFPDISLKNDPTVH